MQEEREKEYTFVFDGTREALFCKARALQKANDASLHTNYLITVKEDEISFGIARAGHSGGYWFVPEITEAEGKILLHGTLRYVGPLPDENRTRLQKLKEALKTAFLLLLSLPFLLIFAIGHWIRRFFRWIARKPKLAVTTEERLYDLMGNYMQCQRK